jgi:pimeloyl-[acyl-carrier protein] methyl ester esterase
LVLLHGFALHGAFFAPLVPVLAEKYRVLVVDLPGHGASQPITPFELSTIVATLEDFVDDLDGPLTVLGWSLGGQVAIEWSRMHAARISKVVLVSTTPSFVVRPGWPHAMLEETLARFGDELRIAYAATLRRFLTLQVQGSEEGRRTLAALRTHLASRDAPQAAALHDALALVARSDLRDRLSDIDTPALVIGGDRDTLVPLAATQALAAALPNAAHRTIAGAAHAPFLSHPHAFVAALAEFLDD